MKIFKIINKNFQSPVNFDFLQKTEEPKVSPIITISREKGSGGIMIADKLAKKLGKKWNYYDKDIVEKIAKESNITTKEVTEIENKSIPYLQDVIESWVGKDYFSLNSYHRTLLKILCDIGNEGYAIIVGRGANFICKNALKVKVIADKEQRIKWLVQYEKMSEKAAKKDVEETDRESNKFISSLYNKDITDPHNFDLVIKTSLQLSLEEAADIIARLAKERFKL